MLEIRLLQLYTPLIAWILFGVWLGHVLPGAIPLKLGKFLYWIGVPLGIFTFLRQADLSGSVWLAPVVAWIAIALSGGLAWLWIILQPYLSRLDPQGSLPQWLHSWIRGAAPAYWSNPTKGSFLLTAMFGNTGYLGYPIALMLVGPHHFAWALFYDTIGSTLGAYVVGVAIAARFGKGTRTMGQFLNALLLNPGLWSFSIGLGCRQVPLPLSLEQTLRGCAWTVIALSLLLIGMRLSQLRSWKKVQQTSVGMVIKMGIVPLLVGWSLPQIGFSGPPHLALVLQIAMPPAFVTLIITEAYDLDRDLTVTALAIGSITLLITLPLWIGLFS